ncbi:MAG: hypothetical protein SLAVMIC_00384 [uncultured marine phage]|uniref:Uncharacterized protein n=1 Tax=uncultured marine phage TaxID=707152 RepID=A0A8D9CBG3_9VIRU|nr:MAG: hypothetical protein SLAVMIC_00384 [uncultured marine phage]
MSETKETMYLTGIILESRKITTKTGTREEVEAFIFDHIDDMVKCKTKNLSTGAFDQELTMGY